jgi:hypothetical protein
MTDGTAGQAPAPKLKDRLVTPLMRRSLRIWRRVSLVLAVIGLASLFDRLVAWPSGSIGSWPTICRLRRIASADKHTTVRAALTVRMTSAAHERNSANASEMW